MTINRFHLLRRRGRPLLLILLLLTLSGGPRVARAKERAAAPGSIPTARHGPATVLTDYCFTTADYAFRAETVGSNVNFTFHPLGATAGGSLVIIYLREGSAGAYPGYNMVGNAAGDFTFTKAIANGVVCSVYFTYQVGPGGPQRTSMTTPHSYTVGTDCAVAANNIPPTVSLTAPTGGATFAAPAAITLTASAADADGTISRVAFYQGTTLLGQALTAPYTFNWTGVVGDCYSLTAVATDNGNARTTSAPVMILVTGSDGYCATRPDYAYSAVTTGANVTFTFHPLGATVGGTLAIVFIREGPSGAYPGYTMGKNAAGDFTFTKAIAGGTVSSVYFTYQVGPGGAQQTSVATPHTYTVGTSCRSATPTATRAPAGAASLIVAPNPSPDRTRLTFTTDRDTPYELALYDLKGARLRVIGTGRATARQAVGLSLAAGELAAGIYLVRLQTDSGVVTQRLVIGH